MAGRFSCFVWTSPDNNRWVECVLSCVLCCIPAAHKNINKGQSLFSIWSAGKCNAPNTPRHSKNLSNNTIVCGSTWADHDSSLTALFRELNKKAWPLFAVNVSLISLRLRSLDLCPQQIAYSISLTVYDCPADCVLDYSSGCTCD